MTNLLIYQDEWKKLKKEQKILIEKYNRSTSKVNKRKYYAEIMKYEDLLFQLKERFERK